MPKGAADRSTATSFHRAAALVIVAFIGACSSLKLGYENADTFLFYKLDSYLDLSRDQAHFVRDRVHGLIAWHRATQLPVYAGFIDTALRRLDQPVAPADVHTMNLEMNRRLQATGDHAAPDLAALALMLEPRQVDRLARKLAEDDAKARHEASASGRKGMEQRVKRSLARTEEWFGSVSPRQREFIREMLAERPDREELWLAERERRRADLVKVVRRIQAERPSVETATEWARAYFHSLTEPAEAERNARMNDYRRDNAAMIAGLVNAATPEQKAVLDRKLRGYADDFVALAGRASRS